MMEKIINFFDLLLQHLGDVFTAFREVPVTTLVEQSIRFRELTIESVMLRMALAMLLGGLIGMERQRKLRPAGFRTYMMVCMGAALTMILGQYEFHMLNTTWVEYASQIGTRIDVSRFGAQVVNGVGFLGAGTILVTEKQQVKGLTTAAGLWASACMGLAIGAGFYEAVILAFILILTVVTLLPKIETSLVEKSRNMNIYVEFRSTEAVNDIIAILKKNSVQICDVEIDRSKKNTTKRPNAVFSVRILNKQSHTGIIAALSQLEVISLIEEI